MCGICGFNFEDAKLAKAMADSISHRGPDSDGVYTDKGVSLGNRRLKIIDLSINGRMPMANKEGNLVITFNGEIYNFESIRNELEGKNYRFKSRTDTEVILNAYQEYGSGCVKLFNGDFAFAIWDSRKKELFLARDRLVIKPLYYYNKGGKFVFASEIKAILQHKDVKRAVNENCLRQIILYAYPIRVETLIENIMELKPGHFLILKNNKIKIEKYWDLKVNETSKAEDFYKKTVQHLLSESVKMRLMADVPLGISLSGGIDSSVLVAMASRHSKEPVKTFTIGFDANDEDCRHARIIADRFGTDHTEIHLEYEDLTKALVKVLWHMEIPISRPAMAPLYYLYNKIREKLTVSLAGEGSDEIFAGYNRYDAYTKLPRAGEVENRNYYNQLKEKISMPLSKKIEYVSSGVFNRDKEEFFSDKLLKIPKEIDVMRTFGPYLKNTKNDGKQLNRALLYELKTEIPYFHCNKLDKLSMANSHEVRVPYLDHTLVEFAMTIPSEYKFYGAGKKIILQKIANELLPKEVAKRRKMPMAVPLSEFFNKEFIDIADNLLSESQIRKREYYKIPGVRKLINNIRQRKVSLDKNNVTEDNAYRQLLFFTNLELWTKLFIDNVKNPKLNINYYI